MINSFKNDKFNYLFIIRKKQDDSWENPSNKKGKKINLNLEELVWLLEVLKSQLSDWSIVYKFKDVQIFSVLFHRFLFLC